MFPATPETFRHTVTYMYMYTNAHRVKSTAVTGCSISVGQCWSAEVNPPPSLHHPLSSGGSWGSEPVWSWTRVHPVGKGAILYVTCSTRNYVIIHAFIVWPKMWWQELVPDPQSLCFDLRLCIDSIATILSLVCVLDSWSLLGLTTLVTASFKVVVWPPKHGTVASLWGTPS